MHKNGFGLIGIIIVVAVLASLTGGGLYLNNLRQKQSLLQIGLEAEKKANALKEKLEAQNRQLLQDETADSVPSEVEGWQTYRNEKYGFEFKYPPAATIKDEQESKSRPLIVSTPYFEILRYSSNGLSLEKWLETRNIESFALAKEYVILGSSKFLKILERAMNSEFYDFCIGNNDDIFIIVASPAKINSAFNQILSTFKFID